MWHFAVVTPALAYWMDSVEGVIVVVPGRHCHERVVRDHRCCQNGRDISVYLFELVAHIRRNERTVSHWLCIISHLSVAEVAVYVTGTAAWRWRRTSPSHQMQVRRAIRYHVLLRRM